MINILALPPLPEPLASFMRKPEPGEPRTALQREIDTLTRMMENARSGPLRDVLRGIDATNALRFLGVAGIPRMAAFLPPVRPGSAMEGLLATLPRCVPNKARSCVPPPRRTMHVHVHVTSADDGATGE